MRGSKEIREKPVAKAKKRVVTNVAKLDPKHPIPIENDQAFSLVNNVSYLPFLAPKDRFGKLLLEARLLSNTNNACIRTKKDYCAAAGFQDKKGNPLDEKILEWFRSINGKNESLTFCNKAIFEDFFTWGNEPIVLARFKVGTEKRFFVYPQNFLEWRLQKPNDDDIIEGAVKSKLFLRDQGFITAALLKNSLNLPIYNPLNEKKSWVKGPDGTERTVIWYKNRMSGLPYYGLPENIASLIFQLLEYKAARFDLDLFENDMVAATLIALKGQVSAPEAKRIAQDVVRTYAGDGNRGRTIVVASEEGIEGSDIHKLETQREGSYSDADNRWTQKIIWANNWDAILAGLVSPNTMGKGAGFITKIFENKLNFVIKPAQQDMMDNVWKTIFKLAQDHLGLPFDKYDLEFKNNIDISGLTDVDISPAVTRDEVRRAKGLPEDGSSQGKKYLRQVSQEVQGQESPKPNKNQGGNNVPPK
jgi:hypothetical protein